MPKPENLERSSSRELGNQNRHEPSKSLDNRHLHGGQKPHGEGEHGPHRGEHDQHDQNKEREHGRRDYEYDQHNKEGEHDQHDKKREDRPDADSNDSERREARDLASLVKPSEDTRVSSLVRDTTEQTDHSFLVGESEPHNDRHDRRTDHAHNEDSADTNPGGGRRDGDRRDHEADPPSYEDHKKDPEFHEGYAQWQKEEARRQEKWSEKATNLAKKEVDRQLRLTGDDIKFDTGTPEQPGQESSERPEYRAYTYKDIYGNYGMLVSDKKTLPDLEIHEKDHESGLTRVPLEDANPLLERAGPENFSGRSDLQAYRRKGKKEVVVTSPENEHKYKENGDYEHIGSVDLSGSREREASQRMVRQAGEYWNGYQKQYGNNGDYGRGDADYKRDNGQGDNRPKSRLEKLTDLVRELRGLIQDLDHLRHGGSSSDQRARKPSFLEKVSDALGDLSDKILSAGTKVGDKD